MLAVVSVGATFGGCGAFLLRHAGASTSAINTMLRANAFTTLVIVFSAPYRMIAALAVGQRSLRLLRPIGIFVLAVEGQLHEVGSVDAHSVDLPSAAAIRLKRDPAAIGRPRRLLVRSFAGDDAALPRDHVRDTNLKTAADARGVADLLSCRRPGFFVVPIAFEGQPLDVRSFGVHHIDLRGAAASGRE